jgi:site-specific recombinase XerD
MTSFRLHFDNNCLAGLSPYRIVDDHDLEIRWINDFLDVQHLRNLSPRSLRSYGYDLLNFARWWCSEKIRPLSQVNESLLLDYVRHQMQSLPRPTPQTINHRLGVVNCLYRFHYCQDIPHERIQASTKTRSSLGYGRPGSRTSGLRLKQPRRVMIPLSREEVARFWASFRSYRDLGMIALMLFNGLRSREVIELRLDDMRFPEAQMLICGKGNKERVLPISQDVIAVLRRYLELERPQESSPFVFLCLKGRRRGRPLTSAGLRSLFRHHRRIADVPMANPHRFRHTFGADMVRCGISVPALMHLMGHSRIHTTMLYVRLSPEDIWSEYRRAIENKTKLLQTEQP